MMTAFLTAGQASKSASKSGNEVGKDKLRENDREGRAQSLEKALQSLRWITDMQARKEQGLLLAVRREESMRCMQEARRQETRRHVPNLSEWREANEKGGAGHSSGRGHRKSENEYNPSETSQSNNPL